jgi:hypothetical protein
VSFRSARVIGIGDPRQCGLWTHCAKIPLLLFPTMSSTMAVDLGKDSHRDAGATLPRFQKQRRQRWQCKLQRERPPVRRLCLSIHPSEVPHATTGLWKSLGTRDVLTLDFVPELRRSKSTPLRQVQGRLCLSNDWRDKGGHPHLGERERPGQPPLVVGMFLLALLFAAWSSRRKVSEPTVQAVPEGRLDVRLRCPTEAKGSR